MRIFRLLAALIIGCIKHGVSSCGDDVTNEIINKIVTILWSCCLVLGREQVKRGFETLTFNKDDTYTEISENETLNGTFEYFLTDICLLLTIQLIGERRIPFTQ